MLMVLLIWVEWEDINTVLQLAVASLQKNTIPLAEMQEGFLYCLTPTSDNDFNSSIDFHSIIVVSLPCTAYQFGTLSKRRFTFNNISSGLSYLFRRNIL